MTTICQPAVFPFNYRKAAAKFSRIAVDEDQYSVYCAVICHIRYCLRLLKVGITKFKMAGLTHTIALLSKDVSSNGPMKVRELHALHRLQNQGKSLSTIHEMWRNPGSRLEGRLREKRTVG